MKKLLIAFLLLTFNAFAQEEKALAVLGSDASLREKAEACRELARVGTGKSVPTLARLLADESLSQMARHALEQIPDPSANAALRDSLGKVKGRLLMGVMHSLGVRKDAEAVQPLSGFLTDPDPAVADAAARALGSIGAVSAPVLERALTQGSNANKSAIMEGLFRCAESMSAGEAARIYEKIRNLPDLPHQMRVAALRGLVKCRGAETVPLLIETLRTESYVSAANAIKMLAEIPGHEVTKVLVTELGRSKPAVQILLLHALGNRGDVTASAALVPLAKDGPANVRVAAIRSLVQLGAPASVPVLVDLVRDPAPDVSNAAMAGLTGFPTKEADEAMLALLEEKNTKLRLSAIDAVAQRRTKAAIPALIKIAVEADTDVAGAGFQALGELADENDVPSVIGALVQTRAVAAAETALAAICARQSDRTSCANSLLSGLARAQGEPKLALLRVLGTVGDSKALAAIRAAAQESDAAVRETAIRVLCDWPTAEVLPDLEQIAKTSEDPKFKILALRAQLRLIPAQDATDARKVSQLKQIMASLERQEEKRLALAALANIHTTDSLEVVIQYLAAEGLNEEAADAAVSIAEQIVISHPAKVAAAMKLVKTNNKKLAERAQQALTRAETAEREEGFKPIFNGKDLSGWDGKPGWWKVEDGALTAESTPDKPCKAPNYIIWRGGQPSDFELLIDFKLSLEGNSGIQIRSEERPDWDTFGYQADMTGNGELIGFIYHHSRGLVAGRGEKVVFAADGTKTVERIGDAAELLKHFKQGDWNTYRIVCRGSDIALYLNGVLMCQVTDRSNQAAAKGIIALQMHPGPPMKVQFKNIRLKEL